MMMRVQHISVTIKQRQWNFLSVDVQLTAKWNKEENLTWKTKALNQVAWRQWSQLVNTDPVCVQVDST